MSVRSHITISSTTSSRNSTPATSPEPVALEVVEWPTTTDWPVDQLPFQDKLDLWVDQSNPRPTSEEVRIFIHDVGILFRHSLEKEREETSKWYDWYHEVRVIFLYSWL